MNYNHITPEEIYKNPEIRCYIEQGNLFLDTLGYTEHGLAHAKRCSNQAGKILKELNFDARTCELANIAGFMHDIGNVINRADHAHNGAIVSFTILSKLNMPPEEISLICSAIGYHDEATAHPVSPVAAALILSDKSDVRSTRVRHIENLAKDIHDRVNFAVKASDIILDADRKKCSFKIKIDTEICQVMEYFEIFLERMILSKKAAEFLGLSFELIINDTRLL